jgi:hypothetical protein
MLMMSGPAWPCSWRPGKGRDCLERADACITDTDRPMNSLPLTPDHHASSRAWLPGSSSVTKQQQHPAITSNTDGTEGVSLMMV